MAQPILPHANLPILSVDVALAPEFVRDELVPPTHTVFVVVDVIRATTTLCVLFERGCARAYIADSISTAREQWHALKSELESPTIWPLLCGEAGGVAPPGFDFGNSPAEYAAADLAGREVVFATTNGTRALHECHDGAQTLIGSFRNATAVARAAVHGAMRLATAGSLSPRADTARSYSLPNTAASDVYTAHSVGQIVATEHIIKTEPRPAVALRIVCAGRGRRPAYDDTICAGHIVGCIEQAITESGWRYRVEEGARIASAALRDAQHIGVRAALAQSEAGRAVTAVGLAPDLDWCAGIDVSGVVPMVVGRDRGGALLVIE
jgi:2-phosphosulfolactate phosphatase